MAKKTTKPQIITFREFVQAAVCNQPLARQMLQDDRSWLTAQSASGETALADVVIESHEEAARFLIGLGAEVNTRAGMGVTPLRYAATLGYSEMVALLLLLHGADVDTADDLEESALFKAAHHGYTNICDALLAAGALSDGKNYRGASVFDVILPRKRAQVLSVFEKHGHRERAEPTV